MAFPTASDGDKQFGSKYEMIFHMNKICCVFLILTVLAFAGTGCQDKTESSTKARVEFKNTVEGNFFFIPEGSTAGYTKMEPDSLGNYAYEWI